MGTSKGEMDQVTEYLEIHHVVYYYEDDWTLAFFTDNMPTETLSKVIEEIGRMGKDSLRLLDVLDEQATGIFKTISEIEDLTLKHLNIEYNNLSLVPPDILARSVLRLEDVNLEGCKLSLDQLVAIFDSIVGCQDLILRNINICSHELPPDIYNCELVDVKGRVKVDHDPVYDPDCDHGWDESYGHVLE